VKESDSQGQEGFMEFPIHWLIILVVVLILFGGRKIPELMRGLGEGVRGFKEGMSGNNQSQATPPPAAPAQPTATTEKPSEEKKS
jgi:sec-independent protein translocase protein TatA